MIPGIDPTGDRLWDSARLLLSLLTSSDAAKIMAEPPEYVLEVMGF